MKQIQRVRIDFGHKRVGLFQNNGKKRFPLYDGMVAVNMDVIIASGKKYDAIGVFDESSSGEHWDTYFFTKDGLMSAEELQKHGTKKDELFPYKYKYRKELHCEDFHINEKTGWSR